MTSSVYKHYMTYLISMAIEVTLKNRVDYDKCSKSCIVRSCNTVI